MKKTISYLLAGAMMLGSTAGAVTITSADVTWDAPRMMVVSGRNDSGNKGEDIVIQILNPGKTSENIMATTADVNTILHMSQVKTDDDGNFTYSFNITDATTNSGDFTIRVKSNKEAGQPTEENIKYYSEVAGGAMETSVSAFAAQMGKTALEPTAVSAVATLVQNDTKEIYYAELPLFDLLSPAAITDMAECITYMTPVATGHDTAAALKIATVIAAAENGAATISDVFEDYGTEIGVNTFSEYTVFSGYNEQYKTLFETFFKSSRGAKNVKQTEYQRLFKEAVVLTELSKAGGSQGIENVLNTYSSYFDLTPLAGGNKNALCLNVSEAFQNGSIKGIGDVQQILDTPVSTTTSRPTGGGGGGGVPAPALPPVIQSAPPSSAPTVPSVDINYNFNDLENHQWAEPAIIDLAKSGIISGMADGEFAPQNYLTRAQACTIICKLFALAESNVKNGKFSDVTADDWYSGFVYAAHNKGIVAGMSDDYFGAEQNISRQDYVVMLHRAAESVDTPFGDIEETIEFSDEQSISEYAMDSVKKFQGWSIVGGRDDGSFDPTGLVTRAEAALIAYNVKIIYEGR